METQDLSNIVDVVVNVSPAAAPRSSFSSMLILGTSHVISAVERARLYTNIAQMITDGFTTDSEEYVAASKFVENFYNYFGNGAAYRLFIGEKTAAETFLAAFTDCRNKNKEWYVGCAPGAVKADHLEISAFVETCQPTTVYVISTDDDEIYNPVGTGVIATGSITFSGITAEAGEMIKTTLIVNGITISQIIPFSALTEGQEIEQFTTYFNNLLAGYSLPFTSEIDAVAVGKINFTANESGTSGNTIVITTENVLNITATVVAMNGGVNSVATILAEGNLATALKILGYKKTLIQFSTDFASVASAMGFAMGQNNLIKNGVAKSSYTLKNKRLTGSVVENLTPGAITSLENENVNVYLNYGDFYNIFEQGVMVNGTFFDEVIQLDILANQIQLGVMDLLYGALKISQTEDGVAQIINAINSICNQFVIVGFIAPGVWKGLPVLNLNTGDALPLGYAIQAPAIASQLQADREARKAPPIYVAIKLAGAIHSVLIQVNVNR